MIKCKMKWEEKWITNPYKCSSYMLLISLEGTQQSLTSHKPCTINNFTVTFQVKLIRIVHGRLKKPWARVHVDFDLSLLAIGRKYMQANYPHI